MRCDCCGKQSNTTAIACETCITWIYCPCNRKFCKTHEQKVWELHLKKCPQKDQIEKGG